MLSVKKLLEGKRTSFVFSVGPESMVIDALELMADKNIGAVMVIDNERLVGIFSERDYARKGIIQGRKAKTTPVTEVMTRGVITVAPDMTIEDCMQIFSDRNFRHLPVVSGGQVLGMVSISDVVKAIMNEQENRIQHLEQYITGY